MYFVVLEESALVFSSLLFLFLFFAVTMLVYCMMNTLDKKNIVLLVASLIFYGWGGPRYRFCCF